MIIRKADKNTEAEVVASTEVLDAMLKYHEDMARAGILLQGEGLRASSSGARVTFSDGKPTVTDGPFTETKELIAGFTMIQVKSMAEAIEWAKRWPVEDVNVALEVRQVFELDDFGPELTPELRQQEERLREHVSQKR